MKAERASLILTSLQEYTPCTARAVLRLTE